MEEYKLLWGLTSEDLAEKVTSYLRAGWMLHGSPFVQGYSSIKVVQAVYWSGIYDIPRCPTEENF